jgi:hypothetical protein
MGLLAPFLSVYLIGMAYCCSEVGPEDVDWEQIFGTEGVRWCVAYNVVVVVLDIILFRSIKANLSLYFLKLHCI